MENFTALGQGELTEVEGGFVISTACVVIIAAEFALAGLHAFIFDAKIKALDAKNGNL